MTLQKDDEEKDNKSIFSEGYLTYEKISLDPLKNSVQFTFHYCDGPRFNSTLQIQSYADADANQMNDIRMDQLENLFFHIGLCILPWYWMGYGCKCIRIEAGYLNPSQVSFWEKFYQNVLSEFLYVHGLDRDRLHIEVNSSPTSKSLYLLPSRNIAKNRVLVPLGGGKDSLVVFQMLTELTDASVECAWIHVGNHPNEFQESWRLQSIIRATRQKCIQAAFLLEHDFLDPVWVNEVAQTGYMPCGHPWAALVAFDAVLSAIMGGFNYIAVGNERSANYGNNVFHEGINVNHQYDKSFEFEVLLHHYVHENIIEDLYYFSALKHLWEIQIAREFCKSPQWFPIFISCNEAVEDRWCGNCAKCAFVFILLSPWCEPAQLWGIFGQNLYEQKSIFPIFDSLWDEKSIKPMECVGTPEETMLSLYLTIERYLSSSHESDLYIPKYLRLRQDEILHGHQLMYLLEGYNEQHLIPPFLLRILHCRTSSLEVDL